MNKNKKNKKLLNKIFCQLNQIDEFKNLNMDKRTEICITAKKMINGEQDEIPCRNDHGCFSQK